MLQQLIAKRKEQQAKKETFVIRGIDLLVPHYVIATALFWAEDQPKRIKDWRIREYPNATEYAVEILRGTESAEHGQLMLDQMEALWNAECRKLHFYNYVEALSVVLSRGIYSPTYRYELCGKVEEVYQRHMADFRKLSVEVFVNKEIEGTVPAIALARLITGQNVYCKTHDILID